MKQDILAEWNPWWHKESKFSLVDRNLKNEIIQWIPKREIIGVLGVRRSGKTSLMYLIIEHLLKSTNPKNILFIKGDDDRVEKKNLVSESIGSYKEFINPKGNIFVFIDEIQDIFEWETALKRLYDLNRDIKFFISGSNFSMLKEDLAYKLSGRLAYFELYPFSFAEFIKSKINAQNKIHVLANKPEIKHHLRKYMEFGGFPEIILEDDNQKKRQLLQFYYDSIVYRDIIKRRGIRSVAKMERMVNYFLQNIANLSNFSKIAKEVSLSVDSVSEYVKYLQDAFFVFSIPLHCFSVKKQEVNPKKIYCVDTGIRNIKGFRFSDDYGRLAENIVFIEIKRRNCTNPLSRIFYWQDKKQREVDFVVIDGKQVKELIQVCWNIEDQEVKDREVEGILSASKEFKCKNLVVITEDLEDVTTIKNKKIRFVPLWKWLLNV